MREALDRALSLCSSWSEMTTVLRKLGYSHLDYKSKLTSANVMDNVLTLPETGPSDGRHDFLPKIMCSNGRLAKEKPSHMGAKP